MVRWSHAGVHVAVRPGSVSVARSSHWVHTFDGAGRWVQGAGAGRWWRRGLDGTVWEGMGGERRGVRLTGDEAAKVAEAARSAAAHALQCWPPALPRPEEDERALRCAVAMDRTRAAADAAAFAALYTGPVPIVPGDLTRAVYLQPTVGCRWNRCTYCSLYADRAHAVRGPVEFAGHVAAVVRWFGAGLGMRRSVFLGDADILVAGAAPVQGWLAELGRAAVLPAATTRAFAAARSVLACAGRDLATLRLAGLGRLYLGLETAAPSVRRRLQRPDSIAQLGDAVRHAQAAGIEIALTVIAGVGGRAAAAEHVAQTAEWIVRSGLRPGSLISVSPLLDETAAVAQPVAPGHLRQSAPCDPGELAHQAAALRDRLAPAGLRVAPYDIAAFVR